MPRIIGVTGTNGAGKGTIVTYLVERHGFAHYSVSGFIVEEIVRRNQPINRDTMIAIGNDLRREHGPSFIVDSLYERTLKSRKPGVIESLRALAEVVRVRELGGFIIGADAAPLIRWRRVIERRSPKDQVSFERFRAQERSEMNPDDPAAQDLRGALAEADVVIRNDGTIEELHGRLAEVLEEARR